MSGELNFDSLDLIEVPVKIAGKAYVLREADEATASDYRSASIQGARLEDGEVVGLPENTGRVQAILVSQCLFPLNAMGTPEKHHVPLTTVKNWPSRIVRPLFDKAKEISELSEGEDTIESLEKEKAKIERRLAKLRRNAAKNGPSDTTAGSG
jgi:hypothetical protein